MISDTKKMSEAGVSRREALRWMGWGGAAAWLAAGTGGRLSGATSDGAAEALATGGVAGVELGGEQAGYYRFKIGAFEAIAFNDGGARRELAQSPVGAGEPIEAIVAELRAAFLPITHLENQFNVLLVRMGAELVLFDSGCGALVGPGAGRLRARMAAAGVRPEQVTAVFLSHAHRDHFGGLIDAETKQPVFANAVHFTGWREHAFWTAASPDVSTLRLPDEGRRGMVAGARAALEAEGLRGRWQLIEPGDRLIEGLEIIDAAGHTPGHLGFLISSEGERLLHFVDAANHFVLSLARPERAFAFDVQPEVAEATRRRLLDRAAAERLRVFGAHMPFPSLGHVKVRDGGGYEYVMAPWSVR